MNRYNSKLGQIVSNAVVGVAPKVASDTANKIVEVALEAAASEGVAVVPVKSAWYSKINWVAIPAAIGGLAAIFGFNLDPTLVATVLSAGMGVIAILRTFFSGSVTPFSVGK